MNEIGNQDSEAATSDAAALQANDRELWSRRLSWMILIVMTAVIAISIAHSPAPVKPGEEYFTICGFKNLTGLPCPGCGLTHSFCEIGKGRLLSAMNFNLLGLPLFLFMIVVWCQALFILTGQVKPALALDTIAARVKPMRFWGMAFALYGAGRIIYILLYDPAARTSNPIAKLFRLISG